MCSLGCAGEVGARRGEPARAGPDSSQGCSPTAAPSRLPNFQTLGPVRTLLETQVAIYLSVCLLHLKAQV